MQAFRRSISGKRREQRNGDLNVRIVETALKLGSEPTANPIPVPPSATKTKRTLASESENLPLIIAAMAKQ